MYHTSSFFVSDSKLIYGAVIRQYPSFERKVIIAAYQKDVVIFLACGGVKTFAGNSCGREQIR